VVVTLLLCGALYDLFYPRTTKMREFDPDEVARLEAAMWRSYYEQQRLTLFNQLAELLRTQYGRLPAEAMTILDRKAESGGVTEADWARIGELLRESWRSLATAVTS